MAKTETKKVKGDWVVVRDAKYYASLSTKPARRKVVLERHHPFAKPLPGIEIRTKRPA